MGDDLPHIHVWPDEGAFVKWSIGKDGHRYMVRSAGVGVDQALQALGGAASGAIVFVEAREAEPGEAPAPCPHLSEEDAAIVAERPAELALGCAHEMVGTRCLRCGGSTNG